MAEPQAHVGSLPAHMSELRGSCSPSFEATLCTARNTEGIPDTAEQLLLRSADMDLQRNLAFQTG